VPSPKEVAISVTVVDKPDASIEVSEALFKFCIVVFKCPLAVDNCPDTPSKAPVPLLIAPLMFKAESPIAVAASDILVSELVKSPARSDMVAPAVPKSVAASSPASPTSDNLSAVGPDALSTSSNPKVAFCAAENSPELSSPTNPSIEVPKLITP
jgi:hypothetical protein